jgi:hypothetical protein
METDWRTPRVIAAVITTAGLVVVIVVFFQHPPQPVVNHLHASEQPVTMNLLPGFEAPVATSPIPPVGY